MDDYLPSEPTAQTTGQPSTEAIRGRIGTSLCFWINGFAVASWISRIPQVKAELGLSEPQLGIALFAMGAGALAGFPLAGTCCARFGSKAATLGFGIFYCVLLSAIPFTQGLAPLMAVLGAFGFFQGAMDVSMNANGVEVEKRYGRSIMSSLHGMWSLGGLMGSGAGLTVIRWAVPIQWHFFAASAIVLAALATAAWLGYGEEPTGHLDHPIFAIPSRPLLSLGALVVCAFLCEGAMGDWSGVYLRDVLKTAPSFAVAGFVVYSTAMTSARFFGDYAMNRWHPATVLRTAGTISALGFGASLILGQPYLMLLGYGCVGLGMSTVAPIGFGAAGRMPGLPPGTAIASVASMGYFGFLVGPPCIGFVAGFVGLKLALGLVVILSVVIALLAASVERRGPTVPNHIP